jgi:hypothetical protein
VLQRLRGGAFPQGLRIQTDPALEPNREHQLPTISLIANHELFRQNGITVTRTQPDTINVTVDEIVEREARVEPAPGTPNLLEGTKFEPATVRVRGPRNALDVDGDGNRALVVYALVPDALLASPGTRDASGLDLTLPPLLVKDRNITIRPAKVDATLQVRASDEQWRMDAMTISLDQPKSIADKFTVVYDTSLPDVTLIGPENIIEEIKKPEGPKPYAQLKVTIEDVGRGEQRRTLRFQDLPERVRVSEKDRQRQITFRLVPRSDIAQ